MLLLRDLSDHGLLRVTGEDRIRFLNGLLTNDVAGLEAGRGLHAAMLTVKGKLLGDLLVYRDDDALLLDVVPAAREPVRAALERHIIVDDVLVDEQGGALALLGAGAAEALRETLEGGAPRELPTERYAHAMAGALRVARVRDLGLDGFRLYGPAEELAALAARLEAAGARQLQDDHAELLRIEAGEPRYGVDMGEDHLPMEALLDDTVSYTKGCYMGQEPIARLSARGHINKRLCGLQLDGDSPPTRGSRLSGPGRDEAGSITSAARSPRLGVIALGYVHRSLFAPGTVLTVHDGGNTRSATVVELPFPAHSTGGSP